MPGEHSLLVLTLTTNGITLHRERQSNDSSNIAKKPQTEISSASDLLAQLPLNLPEALHYDEFESRLKTHHDHEFLARRYMIVDSPTDDSVYEKPVPRKGTKKYLLRYLHELDNAICDLLQGEAVKLRLAGDPAICQLYRTLSHYPHLEAHRPASPSPNPSAQK